MKIGKSGLAADTLTDVTRRVEKEANKGELSDRLQGGYPSKDSRVDVSLSRLIQDELGADQIEAERQARVEALKSQVQSGQYRPSSEAVAQAFVREVGAELLYAQSRSPGNEDE